MRMLLPMVESSTFMNSLFCKEITDLKVFGTGHDQKKVVLVSTQDRRITISQVLHGLYSRPGPLVLENGDQISPDRSRYNSRTTVTDSVVLFEWSEKWKFEYDRQRACDKIERWLASGPRTEDINACAELVAEFGGTVIQKHVAE